jgi:bifunctional DNase/RNase
MEDKVKMEILGLSSSQSQSGSFALVLGEQEGNRRLPIIIGMFEAQAIAIEIEKITPNRPMTHDLFRSFAFNFEYTVKEIVISDLKEGVFFARIVCEQNGKIVEVDSRPSDAIAIGLRFNVDIYAREFILQEAGIVLTDEFEDENEQHPQATAEPKEEKEESQSIGDLSSDKLNEMLNEALENEDYERAAKIRDELNRRN